LFRKPSTLSVDIRFRILLWLIFTIDRQLLVVHSAASNTPDTCGVSSTRGGGQDSFQRATQSN